MSALEDYEDAHVYGPDEWMGALTYFVRKAVSDAAIEQLIWQRDKAARIAGIDISVLDEMWEEQRP